VGHRPKEDPSATADGTDIDNYYTLVEGSYFKTIDFALHFT